MTALLGNSNRPASVTTASTREGSQLKMKLAITVVFVAAALAAAATPSDAQAVTNYGCKTQVWAAMEYLVCSTGDWGAVNGINYGRYYCSVYHYDWGSTTPCSYLGSRSTQTRAARLRAALRGSRGS